LLIDFFMRDAFVITIVIIFIAVVLGVIYNLMRPYLIKLEVLGVDGGVRKTLNDGGIFGSYDSGRSWSQVVATEDEKIFVRSDIFGFQFSAQDSDTLYAASSAGLFVSEDGGEKWQPLTRRGLARGSPVLAFALDPKSPWRMYVTTHDGGRGRIFKSNGDEFYEVYSTQGTGDGVEGVWVDPVETSRIYATTLKGLFLVSEDFGESWKLRHEFSDTVSNLLILRGDTRVMYALEGKRKIIKTSDGGISWRDISGTFSSTGENFRINDIVLDPHDESHLYVAANGGFFESRNAGTTFVRVPTLGSADQISVGAVTVDPKDSDILYIGVGPQVHKSTDAGRNWQIKTLPTSREVRVLSVKVDNSSTIFAGVQHD